MVLNLEKRLYGCKFWKRAKNKFQKIFRFIVCWTAAFFSHEEIHVVRSISIPFLPLSRERFVSFLSIFLSHTRN